jgi:hypothetical protein
MLKPSGSYTYRHVYIQKFHILPTLCGYMFHETVTVNNHYFTIQHWQTGLLYTTCGLNVWAFVLWLFAENITKAPVLECCSMYPPTSQKFPTPTYSSDKCLATSACTNDVFLGLLTHIILLFRPAKWFHLSQPATTKHVSEVYLPHGVHNCSAHT